jgi:leucyl aminopeptidase
MTIESTTSINTQPLLAVFVSAEDLDSTLSNDAFHPELGAWLKATTFKAKAGEVKLFPSVAVTAPGAITTVAIVGLGTDQDERLGAGKVGFIAKEKGITGCTFFNASSAKTTVLHTLLGNYRYDTYKTKKTDSLEVVLLNGTFSDKSIDRAISIAAGRNFARDLVNAPAADLYPESLAEEAQDLAGDNISVEVWGEEKLLEENMNGIIAVGQGSVNPSRFIHLHYKPEGEARKKIVLVGKGVTFDAGGLSLKPSGGMQTMRCDMGGSAVVMGVFQALKGLQPDVEVHGLIGAAENMCSANAYKLGDILTMKNGKTVEIHNTDAEGRLVLADCLVYGDNLEADYIVDFATLTGACVVALGEHYSAIFSNEDDLVDQIKASAAATSERVWQLPLVDIYKSQLKAQWADMKNVGGRAGGSITASLFLSEFVENTKWAHIDIAGPAFLGKTFEHYATGGTGVMVETAVNWIES